MSRVLLFSAVVTRARRILERIELKQVSWPIKPTPLSFLLPFPSAFRGLQPLLSVPLAPEEKTYFQKTLSLSLSWEILADILAIATDFFFIGHISYVFFFVDRFEVERRVFSPGFLSL